LLVVRNPELTVLLVAERQWLGAYFGD
jgi:hypothetical protein